MTFQRRKFQRPQGQRRYKKLFIIAAEGCKTEPIYFNIFTNDNSVMQVTCLKAKNGSSPHHVLKRMTSHLQSADLKHSDEAWLVVDKDQWSDEQLRPLHEWASEKPNYYFALSNPKFEYWLLLHFEDGANIRSSRDCTERLKRKIPDYDKGFDTRKISPLQIEEAIRRAKKRDYPQCDDWPKKIGQTTVYRLVENIIKTNT